MPFVRAKHARSSPYIYSKKRTSLSIFISTVLLVTTVSPASLALNATNTSVAIPALCDPSTLALPISPTPQPEVSLTPESIPAPTPSEGVEPVAESISDDYVAPIIPAGESSATVNKSEPASSPKVVCPSPVTNLIARPQNNQLEISWSPGVNAEPNTIENVTDFYIKVLETAQVIKVSADRTSTIISGLTNGKSYSIIVYAASEHGSSIASDLVTAIPLSGNEGEVAGLIVAFKPEANVEQGQVNVPGEELVSQVELTIENKITEDVHVVEFSEATTLEEAKTIANEISQDPQVVWAEPDQFVYTSAQEVINDPNYSTDQWNLWDKYGIGIGQTNKEMTKAWSLTAGQGINVAVIDTGITSHPDLDSQVIKGFDFVSDPEFLKASREENGPQVSFDGDYINSEKYGALGWDDNPQDPGDWRGVGPVRNSTWHGTHIAGVIAAQSENQEGIAGIAPGAKIQPIRALSWRGGLLSDIASSITWASGGSVTGVADNTTPAKVINMSFSVNSICPTSLQTAINDAFARGSVLVAAAGNNNDNVKNYAPANCENVISVGASNKDGKRASYSNYGLGIDVSAPGGDANDNGIYSTANTGLTEPASLGYTSQQGTSISAAHVSAIAARILSANPEFNPTDVKSQIVKKESVREFADTKCDINVDIYCGEGIVSLFQIAAACSPTQTTSGGYIIQTFTSTTACEWTPNSGITKIDALLVAGGGGGGSRHGGGGGAGGVLWAQNFAVSNSQLSVSVGSGGIGAGLLGSGVSAGASGAGTSGANTTLKLTSNSSNGLTASGGGGGGGVGLAGGSGGGSNYELSAVGSTNQSSQTQRSLTGTTLVAGSNADGTTITNYGNNGGLGIAELDPNYCQRDWCGGGGGGAGAVGGNATISGFGTTSSNGLPGSGGVGIVNPISGSTIGQLVSTSYFLAGGGGGASSDNGLRGTGGNGGGGAGGNNLTAATSGTANTGGGGGGGGFVGPNNNVNSNNLSNQPGGNGGTGVLIIRYLAPPTIASATITGSLGVGQTLTATANTVTGTSPTTTYQWQSAATSGGSYSNISGATSSTYVLTSSESTKFIKVVITVTNTGGTASATSSATSQVNPECSTSDSTYTSGGVTYNVRSFRNTGQCNWAVPSGVSRSEVLVVGGGGGGASRHGGGGGAGGLVHATNYSISGTLTIEVGTGGTGGLSASAGTSGTDSRIFSLGEASVGATGLTAKGGGFGDFYTITSNNIIRAGSGGSGGGAGVADPFTRDLSAGYTNASPIGLTIQSTQTQKNIDGTTLSSNFNQYGNNGAQGGNNSTGTTNAWSGGGGGGAGAAGSRGGGTNGITNYLGGAGGVGIANSITGTSTFYAGGGGGGGGTNGASNFSGGDGGNGGGGAGSAGTATATSGTANSGGGGGGGGLATNGANGRGGSGGSGIVVISYPNAPTVSTISPATGSVTAGGTVTITGTNFVSDQTTATINGVSLTSVNVTSSTTLTAVLPNLTVGTHNLVVNNGGGSATSTAAFTVLTAPTIASASISGTLSIGQTLTATANTVTGTSVTTTYQWQSCASSCATLSNFSNISGATSSTYVLTSSEATKLIRVIITVTNAGGTASATSSATTEVINSCSTTDTSYTSNGVTYVVKQFLSTGTCDFTVPSEITKANILVVGGGGGGGDSLSTSSITGGSGGAGGYFQSNDVSVNGMIQVGVGVGGAGATSSSSQATSGGDSWFGTLKVGGGGGGNSYGFTGSRARAGGGGSDYVSSGNGGGGRAAQGGSNISNTGGLAGAVAVGGVTFLGNTFTGTTGSAGSSGGGDFGSGGLGGQITASSRTSSITGSSVIYAKRGTYSAWDSLSNSDRPQTYGSGGATNYFYGATETAGNTLGGTGAQGVVVVSYASAPTVTAISPTSGSITGNVSVTITGTNFISGSTVTIGGVSLASVSVVSGTSITGTISANTLTSGTKDVVVTTSSGASTGGTGLYEGLSKTTPTLSGFSNTSALFSESTKALTAPTASVAGTFSYSSSDTAVASFASASSSTATLNGVGSATITATFTPTNTSLYNSTTTTLTLTVSQGNQSTLTVTSTSGTFGSALTLTTSGGSGDGSVSYVAAPGTASSCTVSGTSLTAGSAGTCLVTATKASSTNYLSASSVQTTVTFARANQSALTFTSASSVTYGNTLALTSTGGSGTGSTTYAVSSGTCTISSSTLTPGDAGSSCVITATKAADTNYNSVSTSTQTITINKANQATLTIDSAATVAFGSTLTLSTTGGSGTGSVTYSKTGTCTISSSTLTPGEAGSSCVITATKALDTNYNAISSATQTITITKINQSALTISSTSGTFGSALTLTTSGGSTAGSVTYSVSDGTASTCAISTGSLSVASAGTCLVTATMAGNTNYNAVVSTQTTITFAKASQSSLTVTSTSGTYGAALTLITSGGSGDGAVTYVATPGTASSCTVSGSTLTAGSGGTCLVTATKATSTNYLAVSSSQTTVTFSNQAVSLSGFSDISNKTYGDNTFTLTAPTVAGSVAGTFTYSSGTTSVATISGSTVTIVGAGTSTITATFTPTDTGRYSSQTITMLLTVNKKAITVTAEDKTKVYAQSTPTNSFTNSTLVGSDAISSLTYTYSGTNSTSAPTTVGNYTITPSSASFSTGSINNYTITYVPAAYSITKATPAFTGFNNVSKTYGDSSFTITAPTVTGSISGSFAYSSSDTSAITISSATATVAGTGSSLITASFTPTDTTNYNSATTTMTISVAKATQSSLSITSASSVNYGSTISLTSSGGSGTGAISFAVTSGTCSISSTTLTPGNAGSTCVIQATKALDTNYNVATSSTQTITINKINQTVSFTSTAPSSPVSGDTYTPLASATSGAIPTISIASSSSSVCSLSAGIVTFNTSGTCLIEADSASSTNYNAATTASQSITVAKIAQTITFNQPSASSFGDSSRSMNASASSGLAITYSRGASTTNTACSVSSSGVVTILAVGNCEVTAAQSGNSQYDSALSVSRTFAVDAIVPSAPFLTSVSAGNTNATVSFTAPSSNGGANLSAYEVVAMPTSGSNITKSNCSTSASPLACTITGLTNGVSYTFKVAAVNSAGTGAYSTTSGSFTPATIANSVVNLVAQPGDGTLVVNWDQPTDLGGGSFTRYDVYYKSTGSYPGTPNAQINSVSTTTTTFSGLTNGTSYDVKVVAITSANASELAGNTAEVSQYPSTVPSAPTSVTVSKLTGTSARISWGLPLTDGGAALDATTPYVVTITGGASPITCGALSGRTCDITGLTPATTYSVSVKAQNRMGLGNAGTGSYLAPSDDANLFSLDLKTGATLSDPSPATYSPSFNSSTTSYSVTVANTQAYARITPTINEATATIKINGSAVVSGVARNLSLGIGANVFTIEVTAGDLTTTKTYTLTVTRPKASQMPISITSANSVNYGSTITLTTTGGSGSGLITFATTGTCTTSFSGGNYILTPGDVGSSCSIIATKATDDDYFSASSISQTININKTTPTLSGFTNISKTYGDSSFTINEPSVSGNAPGTFTYSSSDTSVATISSSTLTVAGHGTSTITATFNPTSSTNYNSTTISLVVTVAKKALRVTPADKTKFYGASHPTITNSVSGLVGSEDISSISYTYTGTGSTTYSASTTNPTDAGTYSFTPVITSLTSGSLSNYEITYDNANFTISKVNQSALSITSSTSATFGVNLTLAASGGSGTGAVTFTKVSGDCTLNVSGSTYSITPGDAGNNCVLNATKASDTNYNSVSTSDQTITIGKANQSLNFTSSASTTKVNDTYTPVVTSTHSSTGVATSITPSIAIDSASAAVCSITSGIVTFAAAGSCVINADAIASTNYNSATTTSQTLTITVVTPSRSNSNSSNASAPTPTPSPSAGLRPNATNPIIRNVIERPLPEVRVPDITPNLPQINSPALRPVFPSRTNPTIPNNLDTGLAITDNFGRLPLSEPGEKQIKVGNDFVPVIESVSAQGAMTLTIPETINVAPIEVAIQTTDIKGQNIPAPDDGIIRAVKGQTITVSGDGLIPGSTFSVWLFSEPTKLGEGKVSSDSTFNKVFLVPDKLPTGSHTLQINGINSDQKVISLTTGVILTEVKQIQNVSDSNSEIIAYAILFIFFLLLIIAILLRYIRKQQLKYLV